MNQSYVKETYQKIEDNNTYEAYLNESQKAKNAERYERSRVVYSPSRPAPKYYSSWRRDYDFSPSKVVEEEKLASIMRDYINFERELDTTRKALAYRSDFCLLDAFHLFDLYNKTYVSKYEIESALNKLGIFPTYSDLLLFIKRFDIDSDGYIKY